MKAGFAVTIVAIDTVLSALSSPDPKAPYTSSGSGGLWYAKHFFLVYVPVSDGCAWKALSYKPIHVSTQDAFSH
jgi:hypothetical protein